VAIPKSQKIQFAASIFLLFVQCAQAHEHTLCKNNEIVIASCEIAKSNKKNISICASKSTETNQYTAYRYGDINKIELDYTASNSNPKNKIFRGTYTGASNQTTLYWFYNNSLMYQIEIPLTGVVELSVLDGKRQILSKKCKTNALGYPDLKHDFIIDKSSDEMLKVWLQ
jgi:hypothetical protein